MRKLLAVMDGISEWTGRIFSWVIILLMLLVVFEVVMRRFLNRPTIWSFEISIQLYALHFMIVAAYGLLHNAHVSVDVIYERFGSRTKAVLDVITYLIFFFPFLFILLKVSIPYVEKSWAVREVSWSVFAAPLYPVKTVIPVTVILLIIQGLSIFVRQLYFAVKGKQL